MHDIASQLVLMWARKGPEYRIPVADKYVSGSIMGFVESELISRHSMSRLTLDTIALCAMDFRFNSFYQEELHSFIKAMNNILEARSNSQQLFTILQRLLPSHSEQLRKDDEYQNELCRQLVQHRRDNPTEKKDLLNAMIHGRDPRTGETMRDELIGAQMRTFLVAGKSKALLGLSVELTIVLRT